METASDMMFIMDASGRLNYVNQSMCSTLGFAGRIDRHVFPGIDRP